MTGLAGITGRTCAFVMVIGHLSTGPRTRQKIMDVFTLADFEQIFEGVES